MVGHKLFGKAGPDWPQRTRRGQSPKSVFVKPAKAAVVLAATPFFST
jgi:hypothetical protein